MATWHQSKRPVRHGHPTDHTVVVDPPNEFAYSITFHTREAADAWLASLEKRDHRAWVSAYVVPPTGVPR